MDTESPASAHAGSALLPQHNPRELDAWDPGALEDRAEGEGAGSLQPLRGCRG